MWIWLGLTACMTGDLCDGETYVSTCLHPMRTRSCELVTNWAAYDQEWRVRESACAPGRFCDRDANGRDVSCLQPLPRLCEGGRTGGVCHDNDHLVCDPDAALGYRLARDCPDDHVCQTSFPDLPGCLSPWDARLEGNPELEVWRGPARAEVDARMEARRQRTRGVRLQAQ